MLHVDARTVQGALALSDLVLRYQELRSRLQAQESEGRKALRDLKRAIAEAAAALEAGQGSIFEASQALELEVAPAAEPVAVAASPVPPLEAFEAHVERKRSRRASSSASSPSPFAVPAEGAAAVLAGVVPGDYVGTGPEGALRPLELRVYRDAGGELYGLTPEAVARREHGGVGDGPGVRVAILRGWRFVPRGWQEEATA